MKTNSILLTDNDTSEFQTIVVSGESLNRFNLFNDLVLGLNTKYYLSIFKTFRNLLKLLKQ